MVTDVGGSPFVYVESDGRCCEDINASQCVQTSGLWLEVLDLEESSICRSQCDFFGYQCLGYDFRFRNPPTGTCTVLGPNLTTNDVYTVNLLTPDAEFEWISGPAASIEGGQPNSLWTATCFLKVYNTNTTELYDPCPADACGDPCYSNFVPPEGCEDCSCIFDELNTSNTPTFFPIVNPFKNPTGAPTFAFTTTSMAPTASTTTTTATTTTRDFSDLFGGDSATPQVLPDAETAETETGWFKGPQALIVIGVIGCIVIVIIWVFVQSGYDEEKDVSSWAQNKARRVSTYFGVGGTQAEHQGEPGVPGGPTAMDLQMVDMQFAQMEQEMQVIQMQNMQMQIENQALHLQNKQSPGRKSHHGHGRPRGRNSQTRDGRPPRKNKMGMHGHHQNNHPNHHHNKGKATPGHVKQNSYSYTRQPSPGSHMNGLPGHSPRKPSPHKKHKKDKKKRPGRGNKNQQMQNPMHKNQQMQNPMHGFNPQMQGTMNGHNPQMMNVPQNMQQMRQSTVSRKTKKGRRKKKKQQQQQAMQQQKQQAMFGADPGMMMQQQMQINGPMKPNMMKPGLPNPNMVQSNPPNMGPQGMMHATPLPPPHAQKMRHVTPPPPQSMQAPQQGMPPQMQQQMQRQMNPARKQQMHQPQMQQQPPFMQQVPQNPIQMNGMNIPHLYE